MTLPLPNIATKTYQDIIDETIASIPKYSERWTNLNPSDPGVTILELLSFIVETNLYRMNRLSAESYVNFLRLITGASMNEVDLILEKLSRDPVPDRARIRVLECLQKIETGQIRKDIAEIKKASLDFLNSNYRAVTEDDFHALASEVTVFENENEVKVKRTIVTGYPVSGKIEIIVISDRQDKYDDLVGKVKRYLDARKLIGTKVLIKKPVYTPVKIEVEAICSSYAKPDQVEEKIRKRIIDFLDPITGGDRKDGWKYGRSLSVFEIDHIIKDIDEVDHINYLRFDDDANLLNKKIEGFVDTSDLTIRAKKRN